MKHYLSPEGKLFAYCDDGTQDGIIPHDYVPATTEQVQAIQNPPLPAALIRDMAISELEARLTPRRFREALLTGNHDFINGVDAEIAVLRGQL